MAIDVNLNGDSLEVSLVGSFDAAASTGLAERLHHMVKGQTFASVVVDLSRCETLGTQALGGLVGFRLIPSLSQKSFRIRGASAPHQELLHGLCMERLFVIEPSPDV